MWLWYPHLLIFSLAGLYFITLHTVSILLLGFFSLNHWRILDILWNYLLKLPDPQKSIEALPEKIKKKKKHQSESQNSEIADPCKFM